MILDCSTTLTFRFFRTFARTFLFLLNFSALSPTRLRFSYFCYIPLRLNCHVHCSQIVYNILNLNNLEVARFFSDLEGVEVHLCIDFDTKIRTCKGNIGQS